MEKRVLHVGCGPKTIASLPKPFQNGTWSEIRLDVDPKVAPDVVGTMTDMSAVPSGSVHAVFSSHNVEHLYPHEVPVALAEFRRVLGLGGLALVTCPDLQAVAQLVAEDRLMEPAYQSGLGPISPIDILFGHRASVGAGNLFMAHHGGFTLRSLLAALSEAGFRRVIGVRRPREFALWALATTTEPTDEELSAAAARFFPG